MLLQIKSYIRFLLKSTNEHGVHSPFVFDLATNCFYDQKRYPEYEILKKYRESLLKNKSAINVTDFGAGSKVFKSDKREIAAIAKNAGISADRAKLLFRLVKHFKSENILEIGTSLGLATAALSLGKVDAKIISLEGCRETSETARRELTQYRLSNIECITTEFESYIASLANRKFDLIYFDGNHTKEATIKYFELLLPTVTNNSVWIFDDIHWSASMEEAWEFIKQHSEITVTIDTFQWGIVFFRKEQEKENFVIRA